MADEQTAAAEKSTEAVAAELTLTQKLEEALAEIARLKTAAAGPPAPLTPGEKTTDQLMVDFLDGVHVLLGSHPSVHDLWSELRTRFLSRAAAQPKD